MIDPPVFPSFQLPDEPELPVPILEVPIPELPTYEPIFFPQKVEPGLIEQLLEPEVPLIDLPTDPEEVEEDQESAEEETKPSEELESEDRSIDRTLQQVLPYLRRNPRLDNLDGWPYLDEIEPSIPQEAKVEVKPPTEKKELEGVVTVKVLGVGLPIPEPEILVAAGATATTSVAATLATTSMIKKLSGVMKPVIKKAIAKLQHRPVEEMSWGRERLAQRRHKLPNKGYRDET